MKAYSEKLSPKQQQAVLALLTQPKLDEAAKSVGVSAVTLWRWTKRPEFQEEYRAARRQVVEGALAGLQQVAAEAVEALRRNLQSGVPSVEVRAALGILGQALRATELLAVEERLDALERQLEAGEELERRRRTPGGTR
jgi:putative insertion element HTH domain-containing protein